MLTQSRRLLKSSIQFTNGTIITPLLAINMNLRLKCSEIHRFVQCTPLK